MSHSTPPPFSALVEELDRDDPDVQLAAHEKELAELKATVLELRADMRSLKVLLTTVNSKLDRLLIAHGVT